MIQNIEIIIPELFLVCCVLILLVVCLYMKTKFFSENSNKIGTLLLVLTAILVLRQESSIEPVIGGFYSTNYFTSFFKVLLLLLSGTILFLSDNYLKKNDLHIYEFPILILDLSEVDFLKSEEAYNNIIKEIQNFNKDHGYITSKLRRPMW